MQSVGFRPAATALSEMSARVLLHRLDAERHAHDHVGMARRESPPGRRATGLGEDGTALRTRRRVERAAALEEPSLEIDGVDLGMIGKDPGAGIGQHRIRRPRAEKPVHHLDPFAGHLIAQIVVDMLFQAEILRCTMARRGDEIGAAAAARDMVEGRQHPRRHEGRVERGRDRRQQSDARGRMAEDGGDRRRIVARPLQRVAEIGPHRSLVGVGDHQPVLEQQAIEAGRFKGARDVDIEVAARPVGGAGAERLAPHMLRTKS